MGFRYALSTSDGELFDEAEYAYQPQAGDVLHLDGYRRVRVVSVVPVERMAEFVDVGDGHRAPRGRTGLGYFPILQSVKEAAMAGKFVLKKNAGGQFQWNLQAGNGEIIATSETYESKDAALNGIESVKKNAADATTDDQT